jgi:tetratricopeptide (TPR) repeat protein
MKVAPLFKFGSHRFRLPLFLLLAALVFSPAVFVLAVQAQQPVQLSLADILIALRSKKVTIIERNKILADAVKARGITFALTPEIEKELGGGGADPVLVAAIREKNPKPVEQPKPAPAPVATPTPPDYNFYQKRADGFISKGDFDNAITDYDKAIELKPAESITYLYRGIAFFNKKNYDLSLADFSKTIELNPKDVLAYMNRGNSYERLGDLPKAVDDYKKVIDLDPNNAPAKSNLARLQNDLQAKLEPAPKPVAKEPEAAPPTPSAARSDEPAIPANIGSLKNYAVKLAMPMYSQVERQRNIQGIVTVQITLDEEGKIVAVKAISGPVSLRLAAEDAARKSKFTPVKVGEKTIKATGFINYNFQNS